MPLKINKTMKKLVIVGAALAFVASACNNGTHSEEAKTTEKQEAAVASGASYSIDTAASKVDWTGTKPVGAHLENQRGQL